MIEFLFIAKLLAVVFCLTVFGVSLQNRRVVLPSLTVEQRGLDHRLPSTPKRDPAPRR